MNTAVDLSNPEPQRNSFSGCELLSTHAVPRANEDWLRNVERIEAHISPAARLVMHTEPYSMGADRYRLMRMHLQTLERTNGVKVVMVTSALPREGKTMTALNLAIGLSECTAGAVVLAEMDLRYPALTHRLGIEERRGLVESLQDGSDPLSELRRVEPLGIYLLPAGEPASKPFELLNGEGLARTVQQLRSSFEWVILDAPPVIPVPDVLALRDHADGCLWVMRAHSTPRELVKEAMDQVGPDRILGMVLNQAGEMDHLYAPYYNAHRLMLLDGGR